MCTPGVGHSRLREYSPKTQRTDHVWLFEDCKEVGGARAETVAGSGQG